MGSGNAFKGDMGDTYNTGHETNKPIDRSELPYGGEKAIQWVQRKSVEELAKLFDGQAGEKKN